MKLDKINNFYYSKMNKLATFSQKFSQKSNQQGV